MRSELGFLVGDRVLVSQEGRDEPHPGYVSDVLEDGGSAIAVDLDSGIIYVTADTQLTRISES